MGVQANPYPYMKAGDIYVQTSRFEGYCLTLTEARILNRPAWQPILTSYMTRWYRVKTALWWK